MSQPLSRLGKQLEEAISALGKIGVRFALIGGLALAPHKVVRATQDVDLLIDADLAHIEPDGGTRVFPVVRSRGAVRGDSE